MLFVPQETNISYTQKGGKHLSHTGGGTHFNTLGTNICTQKGGANNCTHQRGGDKHLYIMEGGKPFTQGEEQTFSFESADGYDDVDCKEEEDVSKSNILASKLYTSARIPRGP